MLKFPTQGPQGILTQVRYLFISDDQHEMAAQSNMHRDASQELNLVILQALQANGRPMGSWSLYYLLRERGYNISAPTIGRKLRDLEGKKLVGKVTPEGRNITPSGLRMLRKAADDHQLRSSADKVLKLLKSNGRKDIIDQLIVRRLIEGESARLAATNASTRDIAKLEDIVHRQKDLVHKGNLGVREDVGFHESLAKASGNRFLASTVHLLRSQEWMNVAIIAIRAKVGVGLVVEHEKIIAALKERNPAAAQAAMQRHITKMIEEVERYWGEVFRQTPA